MNETPNFNQWMAHVDAEMLKIAGLTSDDIGDYEYRDCYDDGLDPAAAAHEALEAFGYNPEVKYYR